MSDFIKLKSTYENYILHPFNVQCLQYQIDTHDFLHSLMDWGGRSDQWQYRVRENLTSNIQ